ncbi:MAG TPA: electron transfer flavoprotein subunit beta/FixA family protein [candidate division Zixibacteria bacterium]|nr:electron transfer flavoprotein subunit beta/FixA family protein [candidate division Zixibacteria bacterium]
MKIVVCCKAVPGVVTGVAIEPGGKALRYEGQFLAMNECDESALEEALALKRAHGGEVTALTMGPITALDVQYVALAKGADRAVRVDAVAHDPRGTARVLAAALGKLDYDLILTGAQSRDTLAGQVGIAIAHRLGIPFAYAVVDVEVTAGAVRVRKELGGGRYARAELPLPALLCVQTGIQPLTYVPPARMMRARQQPVRSLSLADLGVEPDELVPRGYRFVEVFQPRRTSRVELLDGTPETVAAALLARIKEAL